MKTDKPNEEMTQDRMEELRLEKNEWKEREEEAGEA